MGQVGRPRRGLEEYREFGPEMRKLPYQEQLFVCNLYMGTRTVSSAMRQAGYTAATPNALRVHAHTLLHSERIIAALKEESKRRTATLLPAAQRALGNLLENPNHADHFKAIKMVRDDGGVSAAVERVLNVKVKVEVSDSDKIKAIAAFATSHGIDPKTLLGFDPGAEVIEGEFEEVDDLMKDFV